MKTYLKENFLRIMQMDLNEVVSKKNKENVNLITIVRCLSKLDEYVVKS